MALNKLKFNSINFTHSAGKIIQFDSGADGFDRALIKSIYLYLKTYIHLQMLLI